MAIENNENLDYEKDEPEIKQDEEVPATKGVKESYVSMYNSIFRDLLLKRELLRAIFECGFEHPSRVQHEYVPHTILPMDVLCQTKSGVGKTIVFALTTLQQLETNEEGQCKVLVLCHTRQLVFQISKECERFFKCMTNIEAVSFYCGTHIRNDIEKLNKNVPQLTVETPGRLLHLIRQMVLNLKSLKHFILDDRDKMLNKESMRGDVQEISKLTPYQKQVMMSGAALGGEVRSICKIFMHDPFGIFIEDNPKLTLRGFKQHYLKVKKNEKSRKPFELLDEWQFNKDFSAITIYRQMTRRNRISRCQTLKDSQKLLLIASNLLGRGMDIKRVNIAFSYDMLDDSYIYVHRVDRAGRIETAVSSLKFVYDENHVMILNVVRKRYDAIKFGYVR